MVAHGYKIAIDGVIGAETIGALRSFQKARRFRQSGLADSKTVNALRREPGKKETNPSARPPDQIMPPWMAEMHRRMGLHEVRDNAALSRWLRIGKYLGNPKNLPWCGDAVETCIVKTLPDEAVPNNPFWAQAWRNFGLDTNGVKVGAIGVIRWSSRAGHVGIVADWTRNKVTLLGGNQSNRINLASFPRHKFIAFRWPRTFPFETYPPLTAKAAGGGGASGTR